MKPTVKKFSNKNDFLRKFQEETNKKNDKNLDLAEEEIESIYTSEFNDDL